MDDRRIRTAVTRHFLASTNSSRRIHRLATLILAVPIIAGSILIAPSAGADGTWGNAIEVPGFASIDTGAAAAMIEVSCSSNGNCGAIGQFTDASNFVQAFVENETNGTWGNAQEVPGIAALNAGGAVSNLLTISCSSPGNCSAGGTYTDASKNAQAFVVDETGGTWGNALEVPGFAAFDSLGANGGLVALSCNSAGNCSAGGNYDVTTTQLEAFVVNETNGTWGSAQEVPGTATLNVGGGAVLTTLDCHGVHSCDAAGFYADASGDLQTFVVSESNATWGAADPLPGLQTLNAGGYDYPLQISCSSWSNCGVGGTYTVSTNVTQAFVANETNGTWGTAQEVPGTATLNVGNAASVFSLQCKAPGDCSAGGSYADTTTGSQAFVVNETGGTWGSAEELPGSAALNVGDSASVFDVSCGSSGNCSAGGAYTDSQSNVQAFVVNETNGTWGSAEEMPGTAALNVGGVATVSWLSCNVDGSCSAVGSYDNAPNTPQGFVVDAAADIFVPHAPSIKATSTSDGTLSVTITSVANDGGSPITGYEYSLNDGGWKKASSGLARTFHIAHLTPGKKYGLKLRALNAVGPGKASSTQEAVVR